MFLNGIGSWCISLADERGGVIETGVGYAPMSDELFSAWRGGGGRLNAVTIKVMDATLLGQDSISVDYRLGRVRVHSSTGERERVLPACSKRLQ